MRAAGEAPVRMAGRSTAGASAGPGSPRRDEPDDPGRGPGGHGGRGDRPRLLRGRADLDPARHHLQRGGDRPRLRGQHDRRCARPAGPDRPAGAKPAERRARAGPGPAADLRAAGLRGRDHRAAAAVQRVGPADLADRAVRAAADHRPLPDRDQPGPGEQLDGGAGGLARWAAPQIPVVPFVHHHRYLPAARPVQELLVRPGQHLLPGRFEHRRDIHPADDPGAGPRRLSRAPWSWTSCSARGSTGPAYRGCRRR